MYKMSFNPDNPFVTRTSLEGDDSLGPPDGPKLTKEQREARKKYDTDERFTVPKSNDEFRGGRRFKKRPTARRRRSSKARKSRKARKARTTRRR